jgi:pimeloyl-ACP methyl ester carboxylesterase
MSLAGDARSHGRPTIVGLVALGLCSGALGPGLAALPQDFPRGQIIDSVTCLADPSQGYALYLPSTFSTNRAWPVLMGFHPGARGRAIVDTYRAAAEQYGFIVAGSNNSRNGSWEVSGRAVQAMSHDLGQRLTIDAARVYLTGHSGGSRVAMQVALTNKQIAGVIASSAGYPDVRPRSSVGFPVFGTAGTDDFNYIEMRMLDRALKTPHRVVIFDGGHTLPPPDVAMQAIEWLELQAMRSGSRPRDEAFIDRLWASRERAITGAGETAAAVHLLQDTADDFRQLRDVRTLESRASDLAKRKEIKRALDRERADDDAEMQLVDEYARHLAGLNSDAQRAESLRLLRGLLADLHKKATAVTDSPERARSKRVLRIITMGAGERPEDSEYLKLLQQYRLPGGGRGGGPYGS